MTDRSGTGRGAEGIASCVRPRVLLYSQRYLFPLDVWRYPLYEFEDIIRQIDAVEMVAPLPEKRFPLGFKIAKRVARYSPFAVDPGIPRMRVPGSFDLLFVPCSLPWDLLNFNLDKDWRDRCRISVCLIDEIWVRQIPRQKTYLRILSKFDFVLLNLSRSVPAIGGLSGRPCSFLPPGVDALRFCPHPRPPQRTIDVYSIGRRSEGTHRELLEMAEAGTLFYVYDTLLGKKAVNHKEHRDLYARMAGRSRFFLVNPGLIDDMGKRGDQSDIGNRYFEGAAAGCILIGEAPEIEEFPRLFGWPDAVIPLPFGSKRIGEIIDGFDKQPAREEALHKENIVQSLRRHDWAYRWEALLERVGLPPLPGLGQRKGKLEERAASIEAGTRLQDHAA